MTPEEYIKDNYESIFDSNPKNTVYTNSESIEDLDSIKLEKLCQTDELDKEIVNELINMDKVKMSTIKKLGETLSPNERYDIVVLGNSEFDLRIGRERIYLKFEYSLNSEKIIIAVCISTHNDCALINLAREFKLDEFRLDDVKYIGFINKIIDTYARYV